MKKVGIFIPIGCVLRVWDSIFAVPTPGEKAERGVWAL